MNNPKDNESKSLSKFTNAVVALIMVFLASLTNYFLFLKLLSPEKDVLKAWMIAVGLLGVWGHLYFLQIIKVLFGIHRSYVKHGESSAVKKHLVAYLVIYSFSWLLGIIAAELFRSQI